VLTDSRGTYLRLGPAPYLTGRQLESAVEILGDLLTHVRLTSHLPAG
jgi:hypothetical protein